MAPNEIRDHLARTPFQPFRVYVSDGAVYEVRDPIFALVTMHSFEIATDFAGYGLPTRTIYCDPRRVTRIEPINHVPRA